jgi:hypothetical protein
MWSFRWGFHEKRKEAARDIFCNPQFLRIAATCEPLTQFANF